MMYFHDTKTFAQLESFRASHSDRKWLDAIAVGVSFDEQETYPLRCVTAMTIDGKSKYTDVLVWENGQVKTIKFDNSRRPAIHEEVKKILEVRDVIRYGVYIKKNARGGGELEYFGLFRVDEITDKYFTASFVSHLSEHETRD